MLVTLFYWASPFKTKENIWHTVRRASTTDGLWGAENVGGMPTNHKQSSGSGVIKVTAVSKVSTTLAPGLIVSRDS